MISTWPPTLGRGAQGLKGLTGGFSLLYKFETATGTPPASGRIRYNHATPASATHVYVHDTERNAVNLDALLDTVGVGDLLIVSSESNPARFHIFEVSAISDAGDYHDYTVTYLGGAGTFENGRALWLGIARKGPTGATGATGATGFVAATETVDDTSGDISTTDDYPTWDSAVVSHNVTTAVGDKVLAWATATATWNPGDDTTGIVIGISINGGTPEAVGYFDTSGLGYALSPGLAGGCLFSAPGAGTYAVGLHMSRYGTNAILAAETMRPIRLKTLVVRP